MRCPRCSPLRGELDAWIVSVAECAECWPALAAAERIPPEALDCPTCASSFEEFEAWTDRAEHFEPLVVREMMECDDLLRQIEALPRDAALARVEEDADCHRWGFCQRLLEESKARWFKDPHLAHHLAELAWRVAPRLRAEIYHPQWTADLQAKVHAYLANTYRILGDLVASERAFAAAEAFVEAGVGQGRAEMLVLNLKSTLLVDQHRHLEAEAILDRVERHLREFEQSAELAKVLIKRAMVSAARALPQQAVERMREALRRIDPAREPFLFELARHNLTRYLVDSGEVAEARAQFDQIPEPTDRPVRIRRAWLEADLLRAEGELADAARLYDDVRVAYLADELHFNVALVSLDLAIVARMRGENETVRELARDALVLLTRAGAPQEAFAAIRLLVDAVEHQAVSTAFIERVARRLARVRPAR